MNDGEPSRRDCVAINIVATPSLDGGTRSDEMELLD
jgi:hypothetical protein